VRTIPIKKRSNTELFIDRKQWLFIQKGDKETDYEKLSDLIKEDKVKSSGMKTLWQPVWNDLHRMEGKTS